MQTARLSSQRGYTLFRFGVQRLKFRAPLSLERYIHVKEWDHGYLVVMTKYQHDENLIEEYIDLCPILDDLGIDRDLFLTPIQNVVIHYDELETNCR